MLNHKFYISDAKQDESDCYIRISNIFIEKMVPDLHKCKFTWNGYDKPKYGLSPDITVIKPEALIQIKDCLSKQSEYEEEYPKFMRLVDKALAGRKEVIHESGRPGRLVHDFVICSDFPENIDYKTLKNQFIQIQDQFFMENLDVFEPVKLYWENTENKNEGFNYYGTTLINPQMAQELINAMTEFLKDNATEKAKYFIGEEYDQLVEILSKAILENKVIIHFGI